MRVRSSARLIIIDPDDRVLFFHAGEAPLDPQRSVPDYWYLPGGALEQGESFEDAARREMWEETGIRGVEIGPCVWLREQVLRFPDIGEALAHERFFPVRVMETNLSFFANMIDYEATVFTGHHWWTLDELRTTGDVVFPEGVAGYLEPVLQGDVSGAPFWISDRRDAGDER